MLACLSVALRYAGKLSAKSEAVTAAFVDNTVTIMSRAIIPNPDIKEALEALGNDYGFDGPLTHISKMLVCVQKACSHELVRWVFFSVIDLFRCGDLPAEGVSERALRGMKGQAGLVEIFCFKHACKGHMLGSWLDTMLNDTVYKTSIRAKLADHATYRLHVNPLPPAPHADTSEMLPPLDMSWQKGWLQSAILMLQFIEAVFSSVVWGHACAFDCDVCMLGVTGCHTTCPYQ